MASEDNVILAKNDPRPSGTRVFFRVNHYEPRRANWAILNWERHETVDVDVSSLLKPGDQFRLLTPRDFYGPPILTGRATGQSIQVTMDGERNCSHDFARQPCHFRLLVSAVCRLFSSRNTTLYPPPNLTPEPPG